MQRAMNLPERVGVSGSVGRQGGWTRLGFRDEMAVAGSKAGPEELTLKSSGLRLHSSPQVIQ